MQEEIEQLYEAVDDFVTEMKVRLREQGIKGYGGWDYPEHYRQITEMVMKPASIPSGQEVDTANLSMALWYLRRREGIQ